MTYNLFISHSWAYSDAYDRLVDMLNTKTYFEYKNYSKKITQAQIFTTVKYLYAKALRTVAIIISPDGPDKNAQKAIRGCLREDGKLVLPLDHSDLITMLAKKRDGEDPSDRLCEILDAMLIDLEK